MSLGITRRALAVGVLAVIGFAPNARAQAIIPGNGDRPTGLQIAGKYQTEVKAAMDSVMRELRMGWDSHDAAKLTNLFEDGASLRTRDDSAKGTAQVKAMLERTLPSFRRATFDLKAIDAPDDDAWLTAVGHFEVRVDAQAVGTRPATVRLILHRGFPRGWQVRLMTIDLPTRDVAQLRQVDSVSVERREANEIVAGDTIDSRTGLPDGVEAFVEMRVHNGQHLVDHVVERRIWRDVVGGKPTMHVVLDYEGSNPVADTLILDAVTMMPRSFDAHHNQELHLAFSTNGSVSGTRQRGDAHATKFEEPLGDPMFSVAELPLFAQIIPLEEGASRSLDAVSVWDGSDLAHLAAGAEEPVQITPTLSVMAVPVDVRGPGITMRLWLDPKTHALVMMRSEESDGVTYWMRVMGGL